MNLVQRGKRLLKCIVGGAYDLIRFVRYSTASRPPHDVGSLEAHVTMDYHRIEKGLALPSPRVGFGRDVLSRLLDSVPRLEQLAVDRPAAASARQALREYRQHAAGGGVVIDGLDGFLGPDGAAADCPGGTIEIHRDEVHSAARRDMSAFFSSRHSVRVFADQPVDPTLIHRAVEMAIKTPSVCNRQSFRVHALFDAKLRQDVLSIQGGNRGFGDRAPLALLVASDQRCFVSSAERYQGWIDGGLFAMSLVYAMHSLGLGTCMLNWSVDPRVDLSLRRVMPLPPHENVIMLIAVGHLPDTLRVAASPRHSVSEVLTLH